MLTTASSLPAEGLEAGSEEELSGDAPWAAAVRTTLQVLDPPVSAEELCRRLCVVGLEIFGSTSARAYLRDPETGALACVARAHRRGRLAPRPSDLRAAELEAAFGSLASGAMLLEEDALDASAFAPLARCMGVRWLLVLPLRLDGRLLGFAVAGAGAGSAVGVSGTEGANGDGIPPPARRIATEVARIASLAVGSARLRAEMTRLEHQRCEVLSMVSHELRSPLHVILGWESLLREGDLGELSDEQEDAVARIGRNARQLADVIENTLGAGRIAAGQLPIGIGEVRLIDIVAQVLQEAAALRGDPRLCLVRDVPEDLPPLLTDREKLRVILRNLVGNALKFTDEGEVRVAARAKGDGVEITVSDTGIGIAPDMLDAIFGEFRQAPAPNDRIRGGVGLGLYIVRRMLEKLGGTISVESQLGSGSTFHFTLPASPLAN
ncbi:MAG: HAMP domain-containing histidine kinase [Deltaproteobacteria bacterium]|nr:HAMP domain-containing histidine kinase [Deltaproteobacteria bacterium]